MTPPPNLSGSLGASHCRVREASYISNASHFGGGAIPWKRRGPVSRVADFCSPNSRPILQMRLCCQGHVIRGKKFIACCMIHCNTVWRMGYQYLEWKAPNKRATGELEIILKEDAVARPIYCTVTCLDWLKNPNDYLTQVSRSHTRFE
jgi:hypothetical protein